MRAGSPGPCLQLARDELREGAPGALGHLDELQPELRRHLALHGIVSLEEGDPPVERDDPVAQGELHGEGVAERSLQGRPHEHPGKAQLEDLEAVARLELGGAQSLRAKAPREPLVRRENDVVLEEPEQSLRHLREDPLEGEAGLVDRPWLAACLRPGARETAPADRPGDVDGVVVSREANGVGPSELQPFGRLEREAGDAQVPNLHLRPEEERPVDVLDLVAPVPALPCVRHGHLRDDSAREGPVRSPDYPPRPAPRRRPTPGT